MGNRILATAAILSAMIFAGGCIDERHHRHNVHRVAPYGTVVAPVYIPADPHLGGHSGSIRPPDGKKHRHNGKHHDVKRAPAPAPRPQAQPKPSPKSAMPKPSVAPKAAPKVAPKAAPKTKAAAPAAKKTPAGKSPAPPKKK